MGKHAKYAHVRRGFRKDLGISVNSGWEADFARFLNLLQANDYITGWEYEPQKFLFTEYGYKRGPWVYTPDFVVEFPAGKTITLSEDTYGANGRPKRIWFEVKGQEKSSDRSKWKRFEKHVGDELHVIRRDHIIDIRERFSDLIPHWESWKTRR